jgi:hypothetical protein
MAYTNKQPFHHMVTFSFRSARDVSEQQILKGVEGRETVIDRSMVEDLSSTFNGVDVKHEGTLLLCATREMSEDDVRGLLSRKKVFRHTELTLELLGEPEPGDPADLM